MTQFTAKQIGLFFSIILLILLVVLGISPIGKRIALSVARPFASTWEYVSSQTASIFSRNERENEISRLELRIRELELKAKASDELRLENSQLRKMLSLRSFPTWNIIQAELLTRDPVFWDSCFSIDKGKADGIEIGSAVLFNDALIGRIGVVNQHSAVVDTIVSVKCRIGITLDDGKSNGLLRGTGGRNGDVIPGCIVDFLPLSAVANENDIIVTSGLGGIIPGGIPVAVVRPDKDGSAIHEIEHSRKCLVAAPRDAWDSIRFVSVIVSK
ncbi:MAG: rod shape-determining protein MreC [Victivallales bacterium]|nr:rod shape-determining protein MreC [Victivallales bacterium]